MKSSAFHFSLRHGKITIHVPEAKAGLHQWWAWSNWFSLPLFLLLPFPGTLEELLPELLRCWYMIFLPKLPESGEVWTLESRTESLKYIRNQKIYTKLIKFLISKKDGHSGGDLLSNISKGSLMNHLSSFVTIVDLHQCSIALLYIYIKQKYLALVPFFSCYSPAGSFQPVYWIEQLPRRLSSSFW